MNRHLSRSPFCFWNSSVVKNSVVFCNVQLPFHSYLFNKSFKTLFHKTYQYILGRLVIFTFREHIKRPTEHENAIESEHHLTFDVSAPSRIHRQEPWRRTTQSAWHTFERWHPSARRSHRYTLLKLRLTKPSCQFDSHSVYECICVCSPFVAPKNIYSKIHLNTILNKIMIISWTRNLYFYTKIFDMYSQYNNNVHRMRFTCKELIHLKSLRIYSRWLP